MIKHNDCIFVLVDVQEKFVPAIHHYAEIEKNIQNLMRGLNILNIPILVTEQNPAKLGSTASVLADLVTDMQPISKMTFSCYGEEKFKNALIESGKKQVILAGIETHVCIYQTARDLVVNGYYVEVVADAVSSRTFQNRELGLEKIKQSGAQTTSGEMLLMDLLVSADKPEFKEILKIIK